MSSDPAAFREAATDWLRGEAPRRSRRRWGEGSDSVAVFENWTPEQEIEQTERVRRWERRKYDAGWGALSWSAEYGGQGLPAHLVQVFADAERDFDIPSQTELFGVTQQLVAPTIARWGTPEQRERFVRALLRTDLLACQLFSEPGAGSDLAAVQTRAVQDGDHWVVSGQKVWTSGAAVADWGVALCRTDPSAGKHAGLTMFMIRLDAVGVTVRPIRQMTGGATFNEVFLDDVYVPGTDRLGPVGAGWQVALTTLSAERFDSGLLGLSAVDRLIELARNAPRPLTPIEADQVADVYARAICQRVLAHQVRQAAARGAEPGAEASVGKLFATETMRRTSAAAYAVLGPRGLADRGEWGTFAWSEHLLGAPGYRIAGGSDEIQRTIIAARVLRMRADKKMEKEA